MSNADLSFIFYGFGLLLHIEYKGRTIYECAPCRSVLLPAALTDHECLDCKDLHSTSIRLRMRIQSVAAVRQWAMPSEQQCLTLGGCQLHHCWCTDVS